MDGNTNGSNDGIYERTGLESSVDLIKDRSGGYHSFFFRWDLCGEAGSKSGSENKGSAGWHSHSSNGIAADGSRIFPVTDF